MAVRICLSDAGLSSGTWRRCEATAFTYSASSYAADDVSTQRTFAVTVANAGNQLGIVLTFKVLSNASGTLTIKLQNAAGTTTYTTDTFDVAGTFSPQQSGYEFHSEVRYFPLTSYAMLAGAGNYRYAISCNVAGRISLVRSTTAGAYFYSVVLDADSSVPSNEDSLIIANGCTLTHDANFTYGSAAAPKGLFICEGASWAWAIGVASYTAAFKGTLILSNSAHIDLGSPATPIPIAERATIDLSALPGSNWFDIGNYNSWGYGCQVLNFCGEKGTALETRAAAQANAGQSVIITEDDMSATWRVGDSIILFGKARTDGVADTAVYTIQSIVGTTLTLNANLDYFLYKKGGILNTTRATTQCGIVINGKPGLCLSSTIPQIHSNILQGAYISNCCWGWGGYIYEQTSIVSSVYIVSTSTQGCLMCPSNTVRHHINIDHLFVTAPSSTDDRGLMIRGCTNSTLDTVFSKGGYALLSLAFCAGFSATRLALGPGTSHTAFYYALGISGAGVTITDSLIEGCSNALANIGAYLSTALSEATIVDCIIDNAESYTVYFYSLVTGVRFRDCVIGNILSAGTQDIFVTPGMFARATFVNCDIGSAGMSDMTEAAFGSYLRWGDYKMIANDHRCYEQCGYFRSVGDGLADTTVHTAGSGKFALRFEPLSSTNRLAWSFSVPTGNILGRTMSVAIWTKINSTTFYAGTHQNPRLSVLYDNTTTVTSTATDSTDWQLLSVTFSPTTSYGELTVTLDAATDAIGANAYVYWDDMAVLYPAGYQLDLGTFDVWANALPVVPPIATNLSALSVWTALHAAGYGTGTFGDLVHDKLDAAISSRAADGAAMALTPEERAALNTLLGASSLTLAQAIKVLLAHAAGKTSGMEEGAPVFRDIEDNADVIEGTLDEHGNRLTTEVHV